MMTYEGNENATSAHIGAQGPIVCLGTKKPGRSRRRSAVRHGRELVLAANC